MASQSGKEKAHKHKQIFPVTARVGGGGVSRPGGGVSTDAPQTQSGSNFAKKTHL